MQRRTYTTAIEKTADQPYTQAEAYVGRAEVNELTTANEDALSDYEAASTALDTVDVEKITDVTEQMLEALKIKVYNACAHLNAFFGRNEAAAVSYTKAIDSLAKLPDDADVLDVKATKVVSYTGRADANAAQEKYEEVLPDYDALIALGEDKAADRDAILAAGSLAKSKAGDLNSSDSWLDAVNHADYAESVQLTNAESILKQAAELVQADGAKAYDKVKALLTTEEAKTAMQNLLARGYQLRYYDANGKMLAVYANETAWADVSEAENGAVTAEALTAAAPTAEEIGAVSLSKLYVYYGGHEARSREGEGVWFILNPGKKDLTAETYTWKNDKPEGDFKQKETAPAASAPTASAPTASPKMTKNGILNTINSWRIKQGYAALQLDELCQPEADAIVSVIKKENEGTLSHKEAERQLDALKDSMQNKGLSFWTINYRGYGAGDSGDTRVAIGIINSDEGTYICNILY